MSLVLLGGRPGDVANPLAEDGVVLVGLLLLRPVSRLNGLVVVVGQEVGRAEGLGDQVPAGDGVVDGEEVEGRDGEGVVALGALKLPGIVAVAALVSVEG